MNDPHAVFSGIRSLLATLSGLPLAAVGPKDEGFRFGDHTTQARVDFHLTANVGLGADELRTTYDPDAEIDGDESGPGGAPATGGVVYSAVGDRVQTWTVKVESGRQDHTAHRYAERIRNKLALPSARAALRALGLALQTPVGPTRDLSYTYDSRPISVVVLEFKTNSASGVSDAPVTTINRAEGVARPHTDAGPGADIPFDTGGV